ncbi:MAG TPA: hypothetical protein PLK06_00115 [bacterium]|nr:hypothetical protein [bacterium]
MEPDRLRFAADQCPLPNSGIPSLHHTKWYANGHYPHNRIRYDHDGQTITVFENRFISWHRSFTATTPQPATNPGYIAIHEWIPKYQLKNTSGWFRFGREYTVAYATLHPNYRNDWRQQAKRHFKAFLRSGCTLRNGSKADVELLYKTSQVPKSLQEAMLKVLDRQLLAHPETIDILVAEKNQIPVACLVSGNCDEAKMSEYIIGAFHPNYKKDNPMVGLVDWWYQRSITRGYATLTFGHMEPKTTKGPLSGNGYSFFKTHFNVTRMWFPKNHWRIRLNHKRPTTT